MKSWNNEEQQIRVIISLWEWADKFVNMGFCFRTSELLLPIIYREYAWAMSTGKKNI